MTIYPKDGRRRSVPSPANASPLMWAEIWWLRENLPTLGDNPPKSMRTAAEGLVSGVIIK